jgi:hypothetical protein
VPARALERSGDGQSPLVCNLSACRCASRRSFLGWHPRRSPHRAGHVPDHRRRGRHPPNLRRDLPTGRGVDRRWVVYRRPTAARPAALTRRALIRSRPASPASGGLPESPRVPSRRCGTTRPPRATGLVVGHRPHARARRSASRTAPSRSPISVSTATAKPSSRRSRSARDLCRTAWPANVERRAAATSSWPRSSTARWMSTQSAG